MIKSNTTIIQLKVNSEQKKLLEKAASLKGISLTAYSLNQLLVIAQQELDNYEKLVLSNQDRDLFLSAIENPPSLQGKLKKAIQTYCQKDE